MQIVIPMSGFGERFRRAGYSVPKPLIPVDGKPIIAHVVDLFPGETDFIFICNEDHLKNPEYHLEKALHDICPTGRIVAIPPHKTGPIGAVLKASKTIDFARPTFVNYCDFACYWDWNDFKKFVAETNCAGSVPAYRGFHPHSLGSTYYAYLKEQDGWLVDIQEKAPFTDNPMSEFASSGGYFFSSGELCIDAFEQTVAQNLAVNDEFYVSMAYKILLQRAMPVAIYELQHFMQWGTPDDLTAYKKWSEAFQQLARAPQPKARQDGCLMIPMAGLGKRFSDVGYALPKPLVPVSGKPMFVQATEALPAALQQRFVVRREMPSLDLLIEAQMEAFPKSLHIDLDKATEGQAVTCSIGLAGLKSDTMVTIGTCDAAVLYDASRFKSLLVEDRPDVIVWTVRGHPDGKMRPKMFGWAIASDEGIITEVRVKRDPPSPETTPMIVGIFTFRRVSDFNNAYERLIARNGRVNNEFYVDSLVEDALALGLKCCIFEIDHYLGWGTPNDLMTFEYWQSCFHKWESHTYRLETDPMIPESGLGELRLRYASTPPKRPML